jgi:hypothetical protein
MASAADKKRWDKLHADYAKASEARLQIEIEYDAKYGRGNRQWWPRGAQTKFDKLRERQDKIGEQITELLLRISPRGDRWLSGVPAWWLYERLTWEDAIRPANEPLSVVVPGAYGYPDGYVKEGVQEMPRGTHTDAAHLRDILEKGVILDKDRVEGSVDLNDESPVYVGIIVDVSGYGPHVGAMYLDQNRFHGSADGALQEADQILEEWMLEHYAEDFAKLEREHGDDAMDIFTENFDGWAFKLSPREFVDALEGTPAEQLVDVEEEEEEGEEAEEVAEDRGDFQEPDAKDVLEGLGPYLQHEGHDAARESARIARMIANVRGDSNKADKVLEEVDRLINGHGIEAIRDEDVNDRYYGDVVALYVNTGDTYNATLLYDTDRSEFYVTSWGDWYEQYEQEKEENEKDQEDE